MADFSVVTVRLLPFANGVPPPEGEKILEPKLFQVEELRAMSSNGWA
jgi:hypothetical protein